MRNKRMLVRLVAAVIIGIFAWFSKNQKPSGHGNNNAPKAERVENGFDVFLNCSLVNDKYNDGDSFLVKISDSEVVYRLYYVDTPESRDKPYDDHRRRVEDQGRDMGGLNYQEALNVGKKAKEFTTNLLKKGNFDIYTKHEPVYDSSREYAFVKVNFNGKQQWLHEVLLKEGLARVHTKGVTTPNGESYKKHKAYLNTLSKR